MTESQTELPSFYGLAGVVQWLTTHTRTWSLTANPDQLYFASRREYFQMSSHTRPHEAPGPDLLDPALTPTLYYAAAWPESGIFALQCHGSSPFETLLTLAQMVWDEVQKQQQRERYLPPSL